MESVHSSHESERKREKKRENERASKRASLRARGECDQIQSLDYLKKEQRLNEQISEQACEQMVNAIKFRHQINQKQREK